MNGITRTAGLFALTASIAVATIAGTGSALAGTRTSTPSDTGHLRTVAVLELGAHTLEFVRDGQTGIVGIGEDAPVGARLILDRMTTGDVSALELFKALAPGEKTPEELEADHLRTVKEQRRDTSAVKELTLALPPSAAPGAGSETYIGADCNFDESYIGDSQWAQHWYQSHFYKDDAAQASYFPEDLNGTAGRQWGAGASSVRWLGACNGNHVAGFSEFAFRAIYKSNDGSFKTAYYRQVSPDHQVVYWSFGGPEVWRVKLSEISYNVFLNREFAVGVAKNDPIGGFTTGD